MQPLILSALRKIYPPHAYTLLPPPGQTCEGGESEIALAKVLPDDHDPVLQVTSYEAIDWDYVAAHAETCVVNSYMLRKALIRKHYLAATVEGWAAKRPDSVLRSHVKRSEAFELDYAEFLDDALVEAFDLRASLERNEARSPDDSGIEWWILKPSMSDRGQGIRLFNSMDQLQAIFDEWEEDEPSTDEEGDEDEDDSRRTGAADAITTSHLRHFVAQPYIDPPLLIPGDKRKFHIRTYAACVGSLDVYVYRPMLALFAAKDYSAPGQSSETQNGDDWFESHLTNTCLQRSVAEGTVQRFWDLPVIPRLPVSESPPVDADSDVKPEIFEQICAVTGDVFEAAARGMMMHFRPLSNAFEMFGLDFLVDASGKAWLLEINAFPDFKQTGGDLTEVVEGLWEAVLRRVAVMPKSSNAVASEGDTTILGASTSKQHSEADGLVHVRNVALGSQ